MLKRQRVDISINHERWLVSYADFVTLLFALFVVMYSVSQVNEAKYQELSETLTEVFSDKSSSVSEEQTQSQQPSEQNDTSLTSSIRHTKSLPTLAEQFHDRLSDLIEEQSIRVASNELWLQISLNNRILFPLGGVEPNAQAEAIFKEVANILRDVENPIQVEGFTDNLAISTQQFPSNWELSAARAAAIVKLLISNKVAPQRLSAIGYGEFQPIADNSTEEGRAQNRRVVLMIGKQVRARPTIDIEQSPTPNAQDRVPSIPAEQSAGSANTGDSMVPITLDNGEYLFTSDPELPRLTR